METYDGGWVNAQVTRTMEVWHDCAAGTVKDARQYSPGEQDLREEAYDEALFAVEKDLEKASTRADRMLLQERIVESFGKFSARALSLDGWLDGHDNTTPTWR